MAKGRPPKDTAERLSAAQARVAASIHAGIREQLLARSALRRAEKAHADATALHESMVLVGPAQPVRRPRRGGKSGKGGHWPKLDGDGLIERTRLLNLALAKCHADRGSPTAGTSWADLARVLLGPKAQACRLRHGRRSPTLDRRLREYIGE